MLAEGLQLLSTLSSPRLGDLTISIEHSVVPSTGSTNIATSDGYSRRWTSCIAMVKCWWRLSTDRRTMVVVAVWAGPPRRKWWVAMLYYSTKTLLRSILESLETADEAQWDDRLEVGNQCLYEIHQMARQSYQPYRKDSPNVRRPSQIPDSGRAQQAMPHVKRMMSAIRRRDQAAALESARAALAVM